MQPHLNIAVRAARAAGNVIMRYYRQGEAPDIRSKGHMDYVTAADNEAESVAIDTIRNVYPDHAIVAEESGRRGENEVEWLIDPLDGTTNFIHGFPHFCVSIACVERGRLAHGVVYDPFKEELFTASRGNGAALDGRRIRVSTSRRVHQSLIATGFAYQRREEPDTHLAKFENVLRQSGDIRRAGSAALDLAYVAAGRLDAFWELGLAPWDMAAGMLLVREAGGIADGIGGTDALKSGNVIAGTPKVFAELTGLLSA